MGGSVPRRAARTIAAIDVRRYEARGYVHVLVPRRHVLDLDLGPTTTTWVVWKQCYRACDDSSHTSADVAHAGRMPLH
eukprot:COSAG02_NODE_1179_length_14040_cov_8.036439_6_plen_78_part_00